MTKALITIGTIALVGLLALFALGKMSATGAAPGLRDGKLQPCPVTPNCVCSEYARDPAHAIEALEILAENANRAMPRLKKIVAKLGGKVITSREDYLATTFTSPLFGFVDDVEFRIDASRTTIHIRSASRVGHGDLGANRERIESIRQEFRKTAGGA